MGRAAVASPRDGGGTPMVGTCPAAVGGEVKGDVDHVGTCNTLHSLVL